jgi:hypothetical protein
MPWPAKKDHCDVRARDEVYQGAAHVLVAGVGQRLHIKAKTLERLGNVAGVIDGIGKEGTF